MTDVSLPAAFRAGLLSSVSRSRPYLFGKIEKTVGVLLVATGIAFLTGGFGGETLGTTPAHSSRGI